MKHRLIEGDCAKNVPECDMIFADIPDNIGLNYAQYKDNLPEGDYGEKIRTWLDRFMEKSPIIWLSFNSRWTPMLGAIWHAIPRRRDWSVTPCVQTFTFGNYKKDRLTDCHRPLWLFRREGVPLYPEAILVPSARQLAGDKRAAPGGRVPGNVFDFPRVTGNSRQRRKWHPTQLHEDLVRRCMLYSTLKGAHVCDPFGGTGTTLRVAKQEARRCTLIEIDSSYCAELRKEHPEL